MLCSLFFFFNDTATTEIYTLSLHDALPICVHIVLATAGVAAGLLAMRGARAWKWWVLGSGLVFLSLADLGWYSLRNSYGDMILYLVHNPRVGFGVFVMPPLAMLATLVALWTVVRDAIGRRHSRI